MHVGYCEGNERIIALFSQKFTHKKVLISRIVPEILSTSNLAICQLNELIFVLVCVCEIYSLAISTILKVFFQVIPLAVCCGQKCRLYWNKMNFNVILTIGTWSESLIVTYLDKKVSQKNYFQCRLCSLNSSIIRTLFFF